MKWFQIGKEVCQSCILSPCYFTYMQSTSCKMPGWMKHKLEPKTAGRNINNLRYTDDTTLMAENRQEQEPLDESEREESEKAGLKINIPKTKITASSPITSWQIDGETMENSNRLFSLGSKMTADGDCSHEIKRRLLLGRKAMTNLDSILKSRDITLPTKVCLVKLWFFQWSWMDMRVGP